MASHQYKVVPYSVEIKKGDPVDKASEQLQSAIQEYVSQDWEFIQVANLSIKIKPGCLQGLFGATESIISYDQLIFRKPST